MTQRYAHLAPDYLKKPVNMLVPREEQPSKQPSEKVVGWEGSYVIEKVVGLEGIEPPTNGLGNRCSILLSYRPTHQSAP